MKKQTNSIVKHFKLNFSRIYIYVTETA